jgi:hypothetical protein
MGGGSEASSSLSFAASISNARWLAHPRIGPDGFCLNCLGKLFCIGLIGESEIDLWPTGVPDHCSRIVAGWSLLPRKSSEDYQSCG